VKKSSRLLSVILAAVIILSAAGVGFSAFAALPTANLPVLESVALELKAPHSLETGDITDDVSIGGFSRDVRIVATPFWDDEELAALKNIKPLQYNWYVNGELQATHGKELLIIIKNSTDYYITVEASTYKLDPATGSATSEVIWVSEGDPIQFRTPDAATNREDLYTLNRYSAAKSSLGYVESFWNTFAKAYAKGLAVYANATATQADVDKAYSDLYYAYGALNDNPNAQTPLEPITNENGEIVDDRTDHAYNPDHDPSVKPMSNFTKWIFQAWESIRFAVWDLFLAKIFIWVR
jgi:hypothetical protein